VNKEVISRKIMFGRVDQFCGDPEIVLPPAGVTLRTELGATITALEQLGSDQVSGQGEKSAGATNRQLTAEDLRKKVRGVSRVAGRLNSEVHPGVAEKFKMPRNKAFEVLIITARSFVSELVAPLRAVFADHLGEPYLVELETLVTQFDTATDRKSAGLSDQVESTAGLDDAADRGLKIVKRLDAIMVELLADRPAKLAAWKSISRVERRTNPTAPTTTPTAPAPAPTPAT
jgi:hypothetical protein